MLVLQGTVAKAAAAAPASMFLMAPGVMCMHLVAVAAGVAAIEKYFGFIAGCEQRR